MSIDKIKNKLKNESVKNTTWLADAKWRTENEAWLAVSFTIAVKMLSVLKENKTNKKYPSTQKQLAEAMGCSPQYVNKLVKGKEKLTLETIVKIERVLDFQIINPALLKTTTSKENTSWVCPEVLIKT